MKKVLYFAFNPISELELQALGNVEVSQILSEDVNVLWKTFKTLQRDFDIIACGIGNVEFQVKTLSFLQKINKPMLTPSYLFNLSSGKIFQEWKTVVSIERNNEIDSKYKLFRFNTEKFELMPFSYLGNQ